MQGWNSLKTSAIQELFSYVFCSQLSMSLAIVSFALTGRDLHRFMSENAKNPLDAMMQQLMGESPSEPPVVNEEELRER